MGRHSKPDPEDSVDDLSDGHAAEQQHWEDISGSYDYPGVDQPDDGPLSSEGHYSAVGGYSASGSEDYPDIPPRPDWEPTGAEPIAAAPPPLFRFGHRGPGDWQAGHRSADGRRGVSIGVIVALVAVVVMVAGVILWRFFGDALSNRSHTAAARCVGGKGHRRCYSRPINRRSGKGVSRQLQRVGGPGRRPLCGSGCHLGRLRCRHQWFHRQMADRTGRPAGIVDSE